MSTNHLGLVKWWLASFLLVTSLLLAPAQKSSGPTRAARPFVGYHRYRGMVGGQPVTVELTIGPEVGSSAALVCEGSYHYDRHPAGRLLLSAPRPFRPRQALVLAETDAQRPTGRWLAGQVVGASITGTWRSPTGQLLPFSLREDYTDGRGQLMAVQYEVVEATAKLPCRPERKEEETTANYRARIASIDHGYSQSFLHLLGPDTLRPALRDLQCPVPAVRRQQVRAAAKEDDGCNLYMASLHVDYNAYGLLAWSESWTEEYEAGARPQHGMRSALYDLRTGHIITIEDVFKPSTDTLLQRLITQHILHDDNSDIEPEPGLKVPVHAADLAPLPAAGLSMADKGVEFAYHIDEFDRLPLLLGGTTLFSVIVPFAELLPFLRPDSPVVRMLRERGLWPPAANQSRK
jgi:hypothetical protein